MIRWIKEADISEGGDVGGDYQMTEAWTARFRDAADPTKLLTIYAYGELPEAVWKKFDEGDDLTLEEGRLVVTLQVEALTCTDKMDPGGTETWADGWHLTAVQSSGSTLDPADAEAAAKEIVSRMDTSYPGVFSSAAPVSLRAFVLGEDGR